MTFSESVSRCFSKYASFSGEASRSEVGWFFVFQLLVGAVAGFADGIVFYPKTQFFFSIQAFLLFLLPSIAVLVRRLHDIGRSGWWYCLSFTGVGYLVLLYWWVQPSSTPYQRQHIGFWAAVKSALAKTFQYHGRSSRAEFWQFYLFQLGIDLLILPIAASWLGLSDKPFLYQWGWILLWDIPLFSLLVRRLRDAQYSPWWALLALHPLSFLLLIYGLIQPSKTP